MKILKLKDNYNLDNLLNIGFKKSFIINVGNIYKYDDSEFNYIIGQDKILHFNQMTTNNERGLFIIYELKDNLECINL